MQRLNICHHRHDRCWPFVETLAATKPYGFTTVIDLPTEPDCKGNQKFTAIPRLFESSAGRKSSRGSMTNSLPTQEFSHSVAAHETYLEPIIQRTHPIGDRDNGKARFPCRA